MCTTCFIIPPHLLEEILQRANNSEVREWALRGIQVTESLRGERLANAELWPGVQSHGRQRTVYDAEQRRDLPGRLARAEGQASTHDGSVNEVYDGFGDTYDFFHTIFHRRSLDDRDMRLDGTVHYGRNYPNAFWNGRQMAFGDGDGRFFRSFTRSLDVIGHELAHGVIEHTANLRYYDQSGALNESFADVLGSLVRQWKLNQTAATADWLIGADLMVPASARRALRDMANPGTAYDDPEMGRDPQPGHMNDYLDVVYDNGGVHINSGIPNRAFHLAAVRLGGYAWEQAGMIWYNTLRTRLTNRATFDDAAAATVEVASQMYGRTVAETVASAWNDVGIAVQVPAVISAA